MKICVVSGTNRRNNNTLKIARTSESHFKKLGADTSLLDLQNLPLDLLSPDAYAKKPESFSPFSNAVLESDGLLIVTPEYNGGFPGPLKLFIDMLKFPESYQDRPVAYIGVSAGRWGALRPVEQLQQIFAYRNAFNFNERVFIPNIADALDDNGTLKNEELENRIAEQAGNFMAFIGGIKSRN